MNCPAHLMTFHLPCFFSCLASHFGLTSRLLQSSSFADGCLPTPLRCGPFAQTRRRTGPFSRVQLFWRSLDPALVCKVANVLRLYFTDLILPIISLTTTLQLGKPLMVSHSIVVPKKTVLSTIGGPFKGTIRGNIGKSLETKKSCKKHDFAPQREIRTYFWFVKNAAKKGAPAVQPPGHPPLAAGRPLAAS